MKNLYLCLLIIFIVSCGHQRSNVNMTKSPLINDPPLVKMVHFNTNRTRIIAGEVKLLDQNVEWLSNNADEIIIVEGHCDERGTKAYNMDLGERRARQVKAYLIKKGIEPKKIVIISYGESRPLDTGHNHKAWKRNRRVVFTPAR